MTARPAGLLALSSRLTPIDAGTRQACQNTSLPSTDTNWTHLALKAL
jgi:hypothetical protein